MTADRGSNSEKKGAQTLPGPVSGYGAGLKILVLGLVLVLFCSSLTGLVLDRLYPLNLSAVTWSTVVTARDGTPLRAFPDSNGIWRYPVDLTSQGSFYQEFAESDRPTGT